MGGNEGGSASSSREVAFSVLLGIVLGILSLGVGAVSAFVFVQYWIRGLDMPEMFWLLDLLFTLYTFISPLVALAGLVGFFFAPIYMIKEACRGRVKYDKKERSKDLAASERKRERDLAALSEQCKNVPAVIESETRALERLASEEAAIKVRLEQKKNDCAVKTAAHLNNYTAISTYAKKKYTSLLSMNDWANLDLIIYYFETNRADTIKEALQLADKQRQTDEIVGAICGAAQTISSSIRDNFIQLRTDMVRCFSVLSEQMRVTAEEQSRRIGELSSSIDGMSRQINSSMAGLASSINVQNALQAKANATSAALVSDMNYMRTLAENAEVRRRNNR